MLSVDVARCYGDNAIRYVFPVLWITSCFHVTVHIQWLGDSGHRRATCHTLPEQYRLARSWQQTIWLGGVTDGYLLPSLSFVSQPPK